MLKGTVSASTQNKTGTFHGSNTWVFKVFSVRRRQGEMVWQLLKKVKIELAYHSAIFILDRQPKEVKRGSQTDIIHCAHSSIFTGPKRWKQLKCPMMKGLTRTQYGVCI
jgi:hypothetical protein